MSTADGPLTLHAACRSCVRVHRTQDRQAACSVNGPSAVLIRSGGSHRHLHLLPDWVLLPVVSIGPGHARIRLGRAWREANQYQRLLPERVLADVGFVMSAR